MGQQLHLGSLIKRAPGELASGDHIRGPVIIDKSAKLGQGCLIGPDVSIGPECVIGNGVRLSNCVIMKGCTVRVFALPFVSGRCQPVSPPAWRVVAFAPPRAPTCAPGLWLLYSSSIVGARLQVKNYAFVSNAIIGWYSKLGQWTRTENHSILGEDVSTKDEIYLNGAVVLPHKELKESQAEPKIIM